MELFQCPISLSPATCEHYQVLASGSAFTLKLASFIGERY